MTIFDKRERGFENEFIHNEELKFKATARCNRMLGDWVAGRLGLTGDAAVAYANELVTAGIANQDDSSIILRVSKDLAGKAISEQAIAAKMEQFYRDALTQIKVEG
jgi:hypothetical protein